MERSKTLEADERVVARGTFQCPHGRREANYVITQVVRGDDVLGEYLACRSCGVEFPPTVLEQHHEGEQSSLHGAFSLLFSAMIIADGTVLKRELAMATKLLASLDVDYDIDVLVSDAKRVAGDLTTVLRDASRHLSLGQRRLLLEGAAMIAAADKDFQTDEHELIANAGRHMGFTSQGVREFLESAERRAAV